jgi:hypothetical protein
VDDETRLDARLLERVCLRPDRHAQTFDKGWDEAVAQGWTVVSIENDWRTVFRQAK